MKNFWADCNPLHSHPLFPPKEDSNTVTDKRFTLSMCSHFKRHIFLTSVKSKREVKKQYPVVGGN